MQNKQYSLDLNVVYRVHKDIPNMLKKNSTDT